MCLCCAIDSGWGGSVEAAVAEVVVVMVESGLFLAGVCVWCLVWWLVVFGYSLTSRDLHRIFNFVPHCPSKAPRPQDEDFARG